MVLFKLYAVTFCFPILGRVVVVHGAKRAENDNPNPTHYVLTNPSLKLNMSSEEDC